MHTQTFSTDVYEQIRCLRWLLKCQMLHYDAWVNSSSILRNPTNSKCVFALKLNANHMPNQSYANAKHIKFQFSQLSSYFSSHLTFILYKLFLNFMTNLLCIFSQLSFLLLWHQKAFLSLIVNLLNNISFHLQNSLHSITFLDWTWCCPESCELRTIARGKERQKQKK